MKWLKSFAVTVAILGLISIFNCSGSLSSQELPTPTGGDMLGDLQTKTQYGSLNFWAVIGFGAAVFAAINGSVKIGLSLAGGCISIIALTILLARHANTMAWIGLGALVVAGAVAIYSLFIDKGIFAIRRK